MTDRTVSQLNRDEIKEELQNAKTIAIIGLSSKPDRPSYGVAKYLQDAGYKVYPVNPVETEVLGEKSYPDLKSLPCVPDIVDVFRKSETVMPVVDECLEVGVKSIWFQLGVVNLEAIEKCNKEGIKTVFDKCIKIEHMNLGL